MKKLFAIAAATVAMSSSMAMATPTITINFGGAAGSFGNDAVFCGASGSLGSNGSGGANTWSTSGASAPCTFTDTYTFLSPTGYQLVGGSVTTNALGGVGAVDDINFTSGVAGVTLNGVAFTITVLSGGQFEVGNVNNVAAALPPALNTLIIKGTTYGTGAVNAQTGALDAGSYGGQLTFRAIQAVPEPATWLSMIAGFGALGFALRRSKHQRRVNFNVA